MIEKAYFGFNQEKFDSRLACFWLGSRIKRCWSSQICSDISLLKQSNIINALSGLVSSSPRAISPLKLLIVFINSGIAQGEEPRKEFQGKGSVAWRGLLLWAITGFSLLSL